MTVPKLSDDSALSINIKWLVQIVLLVGTAVYMYLGLENRIKEVEDEAKSLRFNQNTYVFPDIRILENEVLDFKLDRVSFRKSFERQEELIQELRNNE
jgi:hypothetical protein